MANELKIPRIIKDRCQECGFDVELKQCADKPYYMLCSPNVPFDVPLYKELEVEDYKNIRQFANAVEELWHSFDPEEETESILGKTNDEELLYPRVYAECDAFCDNLLDLSESFDESDFYEWFEFEATFTFKGTVKVKARDAEHAYIRLQENFGGVGIDIGQGTLGDDEIDWDIDTHSEDTFDYNE